MKFLPIIFFIAAIFVAASNAGSPVEPLSCDIVAQISYEFTAFTNEILRLYILNLPRSDEFTTDDKTSKLDGLNEVIQRNADVPDEDKQTMQELVNPVDETEGRSMADPLTRASIWDCLVTIFKDGLNAY